jgi:hypothetical protein
MVPWRRFAVSTLAAASAAWPACALAGGIDTAKLDEVRSAVAEAAALEAVQARGRVTETYARGLRGDLRRDLQKLTSDPVLGPLARQGLDALARRDAAALARWRDRLVALERANGRAA